MYCPQCRSELPDDAKYCIKCGYDFSRVKTPPVRKASSDPLDDLETSLGQEIDTSSLTRGSLFANRYEILDEGKKGGMGAVYKCKDTKLNKIVALKIIHPKLLSSQQALSRFRQEVAISQELQHPNIVKVFNLEEWDEKEYFTMEWVEGVTLREVIVKKKAENILFKLDEACKIIAQLADALSHAHKYTIHRDIKPENIMVTDEKDFRVKLTDFGIAKMLSPSQFTSTSMQMGTPYYMAPEQKLDAGNVDKRADIYALGIVLFELLTFSNTVGLKLPSQIIKGIPKGIDDLLVRALEEKPEDRYADAKELSEALGKVVNDAADRAEKQRKEEEQKELEEAKKKKEQEELKSREEEQLRKKTEEKKLKEQEEEKRRKEEEKRLLQEQVGKGEEAKQRKKKSLPLMVMLMLPLIIIGIFIYYQLNKSALTKISGIELVSVKGGCFQMGDTFGDGDPLDERGVNEVCVDDFYIGKYEVTQGQWKEITGSNPSKLKNGDNYPVESVNWDDVQDFIKKLNQKSGKSFRLPTQAEWEYAARSGGKSEKYAGGNDLDAVAWYRDNSGDKTHPVGQKRSNGLGINDMSGNVAEWMQDVSDGTTYIKPSRNNPIYTGSGYNREVRGGSWIIMGSNPLQLRCSTRNSLPHDYRGDEIGFRLASSVK